jgi:hypothetical protein
MAQSADGAFGRPAATRPSPGNEVPEGVSPGRSGVGLTPPGIVVPGCGWRRTAERPHGCLQTLVICGSVSSADVPYLRDICGRHLRHPWRKPRARQSGLTYRPGCVPCTALSGPLCGPLREFCTRCDRTAVRRAERARRYWQAAKGIRRISRAEPLGWLGRRIDTSALLSSV